jgi:hypothetical protein
VRREHDGHFLKEIRHEKSLARGGFGSCRAVTDHSDYGSLILAANVSFGSGACCDAGNECEVPVGLIQRQILASLTSITKVRINCDLNHEEK